MADYIEKKYVEELLKVIKNRDSYYDWEYDMLVEVAVNNLELNIKNTKEEN